MVDLYIFSLIPRLPNLFNAHKKKIGEHGDEANISHCDTDILKLH